MFQDHVRRMFVLPTLHRKLTSRQWTWIGITRVCRRWRALCLSMPELWTTINMDVPRPYKFLKVFLKHSGDAPIDVIGNQSRLAMVPWELLEPHAHRIRSLRLFDLIMSPPTREGSGLALLSSPVDPQGYATTRGVRCDSGQRLLQRTTRRSAPSGPESLPDGRSCFVAFDHHTLSPSPRTQESVM
ncbi:hypothetical protein WOLCODRAFT_139627 [Wolfiporia cocos MD-104 SS10]|uniref:F-box domain-containing protein n=1 Tax=Wolfiporia cocos (strain MD-104) TaxID=742152 RepID=A0A2H3IY01_WOLCO|nr:hypothetical protein WOLCODRAFT_139627 [Wolfiporia cocos MD-104 SS10]